MKVNSLIFLHNEAIPIEIEISLQRGLPNLHVIGLPDQALRESVLRIKGAIRSSGFEWPMARQIIVNLKPSNLKKSGLGLELAIAAGILWETGQLPPPLRPEALVLYGELDLHGNVYEPSDIAMSLMFCSKTLVTGKMEGGARLAGSRMTVPWFQVSNLKDLPMMKLEYPEGSSRFHRPQEFLDFQFNGAQARIIKICSLGGHSSLFAGPPGTGKSLLTSVIHSLREEPKRAENLNLDPVLMWRPLIKPHHSVTKAAMVGGGSQLGSGEVCRSHGGILVTDELLEFRGDVIECLREPAETGIVRLARSTQVRAYQSQFQWLATTNLCPCGKYEPGKPTLCRYSTVRCRSYAQKMSGPLVDRFQILTFSSGWRGGERNRPWMTLLEELETVRSWKKSTKVNAIASEKELLSSPLSFLARKRLENLNDFSERRKLATLRVARTLADLEMSIEMTDRHIKEATSITVDSFERFARWD